MKLVKKLLSFFAVAFLGTAFAETSMTDANFLLQNAENNTAFFGTDFAGTYEVIQERPGEGTSRTNALMYRRDDEGKWTILITGPLKDKGKGYFQLDGNIWFYDPADRRYTFSSSRDRFQNTNANTSDFAPQHYVRDYKIETIKDVKLGAFECVLFELKATAKNVDYPVMKLWVSKNDGLVRKKEDYSLSGQKLRTTAIPAYQPVQNGAKTSYVPVNMVIQDNLKGKKIGNKMEYERTLISISNVKLEKQSNAIFTKNYLEMMSSK